MGNCYADLTKFKNMLGITGTSEDSDIIVNLEAVSRLLEGKKECNRKFWCYEGTRYYDGYLSPLFIPDDLLSITTLKCDFNIDGTFEATLAAGTDYLLYPLNGYPKESIKISPRSTTYVDFNNGIKKGVEIVGVFNYGDGESATPYKDSGAVVNTGNITSGATTHALATGKGALFAVGQTIRIGSEQLYITGISTDTLTFERAKNGTAAAAHTAADVIYIYKYPDAIVKACLIQAARFWKRKDSSFIDTVQSPLSGNVISVYKGLDPDVELIIKDYKKFTQI